MRSIPNPAPFRQTGVAEILDSGTDPQVPGAIRNLIERNGIRPLSQAGQEIVTIAQVPLRSFDLAVILAYLAGVTWFGARFRKGQHSLKDYFLGGRSAPWWAIALSIVSAETSTLTIIGTPPLAYGGSYVFLQVVFGYLLARMVISAIFLPQYFKGQMFTAYA